MKLMKMKKPGDTLNVPCDWCDEPSHFSTVKGSTGIYFYACKSHKDKLESVMDQFKRYKHLGKAN